MSIEPLAYGPTVEALLVACDLPVADLREGVPVRLFGMRQAGKLVGVVGLERFEAVALLRSLAVEGASRGYGYGQALVAHTEAWAAHAGVKEVYLLTTTAADFFARSGYEEMPRSAAPEAIAYTTQFAGLCPSSSIFMRKRLAVHTLRTA